MRTVTEARRIRRTVVLDGLRYQLEQGDKTHARMGLADPPLDEQADALAGIAEGLARQIDAHGRPLDNQVRALAQACVLWLERTGATS